MSVGNRQLEQAIRETYWGDDLVREEHESPSVGIIICKAKDRTIVEYALRDSNRPIGVATYRMVSTLPRELQGQLPSPEQVATLVKGIGYMTADGWACRRWECNEGGRGESPGKYV